MWIRYYSEDISSNMLIQCAFRSFVLLLHFIIPDYEISSDVDYVRTTRPTHCPLCVALSFGDTATLRTAQAALSVIKKEHV